MATNYIWDFATDCYLEEVDDNGGPIANYINEPSQYGRLLSQTRKGERNYYHFDGQGAARELSNGLQEVTDKYSYSAFGTQHIIDGGISINSFRFGASVGYYFDPGSEECYVRHREYSPKFARWLSADPIEFRLSRAIWTYVDRPARLDGSWNLYEFVFGNPLSFVDASGLKVEVCCRTTNIPLVGSLCGVSHCWVRTDTKQIGRGVVEGKCCNSLPCATTRQVDHSKELGKCEDAASYMNHSGTMLFWYDCDEKCVNDHLQAGQEIGRFFPLLADCHFFVFQILHQCCKHVLSPPEDSSSGWPIY